MSSEQSSIDPQAVEQTKRQIRGLVEEITALAKQDVDPAAFYEEFLKRVVEALAAVGGAVWTISEDRQFQLAYQINLQRTSLDERGEHQMRHARLLAQVVQSGEGTLVPPHSGSGDEGAGANPTELLLVLAPLVSEQQTEAVVEIFQRPTPQPATRRGYLRFVLQMCEVASGWLTNRKLQQLGSRQSLWAQVDDFARSVHESLDVRHTAYVVANEAQRLVGCDRVSVAIRRGNKCRVEAVSGQDAFDKRSNTVTLLGRLATRVVRMGQPLWFAGDTRDLPPQVEEAVHDYVDTSHTKTICIVPISKTVIDQTTSEDESTVRARPDPPLIAAVIFEQIEEIRPRAELAPRIDLVCGHAARALSNALAHNSVFLMPLWRTIGHSRVLVRARTLPKTVLVLAAIIAVVVAMVTVPWDFEVKAPGVLQPVKRSEVYVQVEGSVVEEVLVEDGQRVRKGDELVRLQDLALEGQYIELLGRVSSTEQELALTRLRANDDSLPPSQQQESKGQLAEVEQRLKSLKKQLAIVNAKRDRLVVRSPQDGQVITWDVERLLRGRPVQPGQVLLTVVDPDGPWQLEIFMPERRMGHIADAEAELAAGEPLKVRYYVETDPTDQHQGTVDKIDTSAHLEKEHGHVVSMFVAVDKNQLHDPRTGATVTARVYCGETSIGYACLHDVFEFIDSIILFNLW